MGIMRLDIAGDRYSKDTYGHDLDRLVASLDNMTERRVVPVASFTPSTLHGRDGLQWAVLAMFLARAPESDDALIRRVEELA